MKTMVASVFKVALVAINLLGGAVALLEPLPMPDIMAECIKYRTNSTEISEVPTQTIASYCLNHFMYKTMDLRPQRPVANESIAYVQELFRMAFGDINQGRHKRQAQRPRYRQEVRSMSPARWNRFTRALQRLKDEQVRPGLSRYDSLADVHRMVIDSAHDGPAFLGWHRIFLIVFEFALGPGIALPYWDSRLDFYMVNPVQSVVWTPRFFGNGFGEVVTGPAAGWRSIDGSAVIRNIGNSATLFNDEAVDIVMRQPDYDAITEPNRIPVRSLEMHHNGPHVWCGGHMAGLATAPFDPVFYMHHAFVDYIYREWREARPGSHNDYPQKGEDPHGAYSPMNPFTGLLNIYGLHPFYDSYYRYERSPRNCPCGPSRHLECSPEGRCRSRRARGGSTPTASALSAFGVGTTFMSDQTFDGPARAVESIIRNGPLEIGQRFASPFHDERTRDNLPLPTREETLRFRRSIRGARHSTVLSPRPKVSENRTLLETVSENKKPTVTVTRTSSLPGNSAISHDYKNSYVINGEKDTKGWAYIPVRVVFEKHSHNNESTHPAKTYQHCQASGSGAAKIFVQTDGIDYSGRFTDYVIVDERKEVVSGVTYIGVKNPEKSSALFMMSAYDSCGRVCAARCLKDGQYKPCSGTFYVDKQFPRLYSSTLDGAIDNVWKDNDSLLANPRSEHIPVTFVCEYTYSWPWHFQ